MNDTKLIQQLLAQGFTEKDIAILRQYVEKEGETYFSLLNQLKKRLTVAFFFSLLLIAIWIFQSIITPEDTLLLSITMIIVFLIIYFMTPVRLAAKAYLFLRRNF